MYKKILVPLDRNAGAEAALPVAADLAKPDGAVIRLLHVAPPPSTIAAEAVLRRSEVPVVLVRHGLPAAA
jgi:hypothetical protein